MKLLEITNYEQPYALMVNDKLQKMFSSEGEARHAAPKKGHWQVVNKISGKVLAASENTKPSPEEMVQALQVQAATAGD